jgi:hypothetical protein
MVQTEQPLRATFPAKIPLDCLLELPLDCLYREINGKYFVTHPIRRKVIVLNMTGFKVFALCHQRTLASVRSMLAVDDPSVDTKDLENFVLSLAEHGLLVVHEPANDPNG